MNPENKKKTPWYLQCTLFPDFTSIHYEINFSTNDGMIISISSDKTCGFLRPWFLVNVARPPFWKKETGVNKLSFCACPFQILLTKWTAVHFRKLFVFQISRNEVSTWKTSSVTGRFARLYVSFDWEMKEVTIAKILVNDSQRRKFHWETYFDLQL